MDKLARYIESLVFASTDPISLNEISEALRKFTGEEYTDDLLEVYMNQIQQRYDEDQDQFMELNQLSGGYQFMTKPEYSGLIQAHIKNVTRKKLSRSAMETLAVIAYKQPVTKPEIERIRGVGCDYQIQKLLEKEYVSITGRADSPGKPILYGTSAKFMDHFGLKTIADLPMLKEIITSDTEIGIDPVEVMPDQFDEQISNDGSAISESDSEE